MKLQIRKNCFESNSSSLHSLIVTKNKDTYTKQEIRDEFCLDEDWHKDRSDANILTLYSYDNTFGREFRILNSFSDKLDYAIASYCGDCYSLDSYIKAEKKFNEIFVPLLKELVGVDEVKMPTNSNKFEIYTDSINPDDENQDIRTYEEVPFDKLVYDSESYNVKDYDKDGREVSIIWISDLIDAGGIDHQSSGLLSGFMKKYDVSLKEFLINKNIIVVVDGDECQILNSIKQTGLINEDNIALQFPTYGQSYETYQYYLHKDKESENKINEKTN